MKLLVTGVTWCKDAYATAEGSDCLMLLTEWNEYRDLDFERLGTLMRTRTFVDCRNIYDPREVTDHGFRHTAVGRSLEATAPWKLEDVIVRAGSDEAVPRPEIVPERTS